MSIHINNFTFKQLSKMKTITLTEKLEERAKKKLEADIKNLRSLLNNNPIAKRMEIKVSRNDKLKVDTLSRMFNWDCPETDLIITQLLPEYIEHETNEFIAKVEQLSEQVEDLQNQINN